jgi:elongation factor Ts
MVEVNSETDFVARDENFRHFVDQVTHCILRTGLTDVAQLAEAELVAGGETVEVSRQALVQKIGENIQIRRAVKLQNDGGVVGAYVHGNKIGVLASLNGGNLELGKDVAMHIAASNPAVVTPDQVDQATIDKEREIYTAQAQDSGKPAEIVAKMIDGRIAKFLKEVSLVEQPFVKDPEITVGKLVSKAGASVAGFVRFEVGEGIEKEEVDFAAEVMAQVKGQG